jgi:hypothetical protein
MDAGNGLGMARLAFPVGQMSDHLYLVKWPAGQVELHGSSPEDALKATLAYIKAKGLIEVQPHMPAVVEFHE